MRRACFSVALLARLVASGFGPLEADFTTALEVAPAGSRAVILDVGANDGQWSRAWTSVAHRAVARGVLLDIYIVEPSEPRS